VHIGIGFPHAAIGSDPMLARDFAQAAEQEGFAFLSAFEHVAGASAERFVGIDTGFRAPPYLYHHPFHEPFTLFSYLAGLTSRIEFATNVLVLPQRQTVLVAKQAAEVALLSEGRFRLGVGVGWNHAEYEALGADFHTRGRREAEQIQLLRKLWSEPVVTFEGQWHTVDRVGIAPLPRQPIPIWVGGGTGEATLRRVARLADGWMPMLRPDGAAELMTRMRRHLEEAGRDPASLAVQTGLASSGGPGDWVSAAKALAGVGVTHLAVMPGGDPAATALQGLERAREIKGAVELELGD
jgi:probable F420-dependent oxidoreductase